MSSVNPLPSTGIPIGLIGIGKIARDQHLPALADQSAFSLASVASRNARLDGIPSFPDLAAMIAAVPDLAAVSICTPPKGRYAIARAAIAAGLHVMIEKPPGMSVSEVHDLQALAYAKGVSLFATWHSREAPAVALTRDWLAKRSITRVTVEWKEDVRVWHPGQDWIFEAGGFGVFDPGINALSIITSILPGSLVLEDARLSFPEGRSTPIFAQLLLRHADQAEVFVDLDFLQTGPQLWRIVVTTDSGVLEMNDGGAALSIDGKPQVLPASREYPNLYDRFAQLIADRTSDVDVSPLQIVADAFLCGQRVETEPFTF